MPQIGTLNSITVPPQRGELLLDRYPIDAAFSLRRVRSDYDGPCVRVYAGNNSGGERIYADIGFTPEGDLDVEALKRHCTNGGTKLGVDGFVHTWYNQSAEGGKYNAVQTATADMPKIFDATEGYLGCIENTGNRYLRSENQLTGVTDLALVYEKSADGVGNYVIGEHNAANARNGIQCMATASASASLGLSWNMSGSNTLTDVGTDTGETIDEKFAGFFYTNGSEKFGVVNGYVAGRNDSATSFDFDYIFTMATNDGSQDNFDFAGKVYEVFLSTSDLSANRIEIENDVLYNNGLPVPGTSFVRENPGAKLAISTRSLNREYVGPIVEVRGAQTTEVTEGVYLDSTGVVNEAKITALCTDDQAGDALVDGFVRTWYDQSGEGNDAVNTDDASQPKIHDATDGIIFSNGAIGVEFADSLGNLNTGYTPASGDFSFYVVGNVTSAGEDNLDNIIGTVQHAQANDVGRWYFSNSSNNEQFTFGSYGQETVNLSTTVGSVPINEMFLGSVSVDSEGNSSVYSSGRLEASSTGATTSHSSSLVVGRTNISRGFSGVLSEISFYEDDTASQRETIEENINKYFLIYQQAPKATSTGFYADHEDVGFAVSLRQIHSDALLCMEVTRTSDGQSRNIGFKNGIVDTAAIEAWCGAGDGRVTKLYNQIEDDHHFDQYQTTFTHLTPAYLNTPKICDSGSVIMHEGHPAMYHDSPWVQGVIQTDYRMLGASNPYELPNIDRFSYHAVADRIDGSGRFIHGNAGGGGWAVYDSGRAFRLYNTRNAAIHNEKFATTSLSYYNDIQDGVQSGEQRFIGGDTESIGSIALSQEVVQAPDTLRVRRIGSDEIYSSGSNYPFSGHTFEFILMTSAQDDTKLALQNEQINEFYLSTENNETTHSTGFLNEFSGAAAAYSVRKLGDGKFCMRVRKTVSSVDYYMNVGFDSNGDLDTAAIEEFGGTADVFVQTWYDQSGNGKHATQDTNAAQPKIYDGTNGIEKENGYPTINFDGIDDYLEVDGYIVELSQNSASVFALSNVGTSGASDYLLSEGDAESPYSSNFILGGGGDVTPRPVVWVNGTGFGTQTTGQNLIGFDYDGTNFQAHLDGGASGSSGTATVNAEIVGGNAVIGSRASGDTDFYSGNLQELITYKSDKSSSRSDIEDNINNYYLIYQSASASPATGLLSKAPNAHTAISTRQLGDALLCLRARRVSDDAERNIGFVGGKLDEATLEEFSQGGDVRIVKWYDQSGNDRHYYDPSGRSHTLDGTDYTFGAVTDQSTLQMPIIYEETFGLAKFKGFPCVDGGGPSSGSPLYSSNCGDEKATMAFYVGEAKCNNDSTLFCTDRVVDVTGQLSEYYIRTFDGDLAFNGSVTGSYWSYKGRPDKYPSAENNFLDDYQLAQYSLDVNNAVSGSDDSSEPLLGGRFSVFSEGPPPQSGVSVNPARAKYIEFITYSSGDFDEMRAIVDTDQNNYYRIYDTFKSGLLDSFPGAVAAYSLRRLSSSYDGPLIRVSRNGFEVDVYPNGQGELNTGELLDLSPVDSGDTIEVVTWYDQSGNGNHLTADAANAPKIKTGEVSPTSGIQNVSYVNGNPALRFTRADQLGLSATGFSIVGESGDFSAFAVYTEDSSDQSNSAIYFGEESHQMRTATNLYGSYYYDGGTYSEPINSGRTSTDGIRLVSSHADGTNYKIFTNGGDEVSSTLLGTPDNPTTGVSLGNTEALNRGLDGHLLEVVLYDSDQTSNRAGIEKDINRHYKVYDQPLLDVVPDAAAAYSLRKLRSDYTGPAINVYNGTDYKDIYFRTNGELDTKEIQRFCGSNNGTVAVWYDQSGNNNHAEQTDTSLMPKVYDGATGLMTENNKPIVTDNDATTAYLTADVSMSTGNYVFGVVRGDNDYFNFLNGDSDQEFLLVGQDGVTSSSTGGVSNLTTFVNGSSISLPSRDSVHDEFRDTQSLITAEFDMTTSKVTFGYSFSASVSIMATQELIIYTSDQSSNRNVAEANINHYYSIY